MKRILSLVLSVLLVMSTMAVVALADAPATITFGTNLRDVPAGSKIVVNTGDVAEGQSVVTTINGVDSAAEVVNGKYVVTIPESYQEVTVSVKEGDTVIAKTPTVEFYGLSAGEGTVKTDITWETVSNTSTEAEFDAIKTKGAETKMGIDSGVSSIVSENGNKYLTRVNWGTKVSDPCYKTNPDAAVANGKNWSITSLAPSDHTGVAVTSIDFKYDKMEVINGETGDVEKTITIANATDEDITDLMMVEDSSILIFQAVVDGARKHNPIFSYDSSENQMVANVYGDNGEVIKTPLDVNIGEWHNYKAIHDVSKNTLYIYVDDVFVCSGKIMTLADSTSVPTAVKWPYTYCMRTNAEENVRAYAYDDNFKVTYYDDFVEKAEASVEIGTPVTNYVPEGTKVNVGFKSENLKYNQRAAVFANGAEVTLDAKGTLTLNEGYTSIFAAVLDANGNIAKDADGEEIKTAEVVYNAFGITGEPAVRTFATFDEDKYVEGDTNVDTGRTVTSADIGYHKFIGINTNYRAVWNKHFSEATEGTNKYAKITRWGSAIASPYETQVADGGASNFASSQRDLAEIVDVSVDYRFDKLELVDATTGSVTSTLLLNSAENMAAAFVADGTSVLRGIDILSWQPSINDSYKQLAVLGVDKTTGKIVAYVNSKIASGATAVTNEPVKIDGINPGEWNNYRIVGDMSSNYMWIYVNDILVASGTIFTDENKTPQTPDEIFWPMVNTANFYNTKNVRLYAGFDNFKATTYTGKEAAGTEAFVNVTANGVGLVPGNLEASKKVANMAIAARAADGSVEVHEYDASASTDTYKYFSFAKPAIKIFVWDWSNLKPLEEAIEFGAN